MAKSLQGNDLLMSEQTLWLPGIEAPFSHSPGVVAIIGTFAISRIVCTNLYLSPCGEGVGGHRFQVHDFDTSSALGSNSPKSVCPNGRALHCGVKRTVKNYNKAL